MFKKVVLTASAACVLAVMLSGCTQDDVSLVKGTIMDIDRSLTVGEAFDNWQDCATREWETFETDNGRRVVQFTCDIKNAKEFYGLMSGYLGTNPVAFSVDYQKQIVQWVVNKDDTVSLSYVGTETTWLDGKRYAAKSDDPESTIRDAYINKLSYDISAKSELEKEFLKAAAASLVFIFTSIYAQAK